MSGGTATIARQKAREAAGANAPTAAQRAWLQRGLAQPGGKLPLFDAVGRRVNGRMVRRCLEAGWAEPWFANPLRPSWLVCKLTDIGRRAANGTDA